MAQQNRSTDIVTSAGMWGTLGGNARAPVRSLTTFATIAKFGAIGVVFAHTRTGSRETRREKAEVKGKVKVVRTPVAWRVHLIWEVYKQ